uniref:Peptidase A2 domain-containing protein n=2 Tax=Globisporangium ultimum (strain ATCC 200006 / CBS 805.95 / DAOM BR144) TaxID=431595 RepID=K3WF07_GLOUD
KKRERPVGAGLPTGRTKSSVNVVEAQNSCPGVCNAHEVSANRCERVEQEPTLIVHKVKVDGYSEPLRALVDTGASNNFVRTQVVRRQGLDLPISNKEMIVRLANGSKVTMPKRVLRMAIE